MWFMAPEQGKSKHASLTYTFILTLGRPSQVLSDQSQFFLNKLAVHKPADIAEIEIYSLGINLALILPFFHFNLSQKLKFCKKL